MPYLSELILSKIVILKKFCKKLGRETLLRHFVRLDFCNLAAQNKSLIYMKKVLFILFSFLAFGISVNAQSIFGKSVIVLTQKNGDREPSEQVGDTSPEDAPKVRSTISQPVCASLYNKVKALTGMGVNDYINKIRIEKASLMLIQTDLTISEISYEVGFTYQRYFSTIFKQVKGMTPTQFKEENRRKDCCSCTY